MTFITWLIALVFSAAVQTAPGAPQRFDYLVRADFFAGAAGDEARLAKVIELTERTLAENPAHGEAMVWHRGRDAGARGAGVPGRRHGGGGAGALFEKGLKEMSDAVTLAPDNPGVLIPRGAVLLEATRTMPPDTARPLIASAVKNYERALDIQGARFNTLGDHAKGELLFGLADGYARLGDQEHAPPVFRARHRRCALVRPGAQSAREWMKPTGVVPKASGMNCVGCHK